MCVLDPGIPAVMFVTDLVRRVFGRNAASAKLATLAPLSAAIVARHRMIWPASRRGVRQLAAAPNERRRLAFEQMKAYALYAAARSMQILCGL